MNIAGLLFIAFLFGMLVGGFMALASQESKTEYHWDRWEQ